jgi:hypothetical protein
MNTTLKNKKVTFRKSDFHTAQSCNPPHPNLDCVAVAIKDGVVAVRSTHDPAKKTVRFNQREWQNFLVAAKAGHFDM